MRAWVSRLRKGIATSPTERERKRNQAVSPPGRFTLVTFWSLGSIAPVWSCASHFRFAPESGPAADVTACLKRAITRSSQRPSVHLSSFKPRKLRRPKENPPQSTQAISRAWKASRKKERLSRSFLLSSARMPLTIVAHILPGRRVVVRPTLAAMGSVSAARTHGVDARLSTAEPAAADVHCTALTDAAAPRGEGRRCNC